MSALFVSQQGCGGIQHIPLNPFLGLDISDPQVGDNTSGATTIPVQALQPRELREGEYLLVHGQGHIFQAGYARFSFSGNAETEVLLQRPVGEIRVRIPPGARTGPLGFLISARSVHFSQGGGNFATGDPIRAYRIPYPGVRILGPGEPPGGFTGSPYPQGPPISPIPVAPQAGYP